MGQEHAAKIDKADELFTSPFSWAWILVAEYVSAFLRKAINMVGVRARPER